MEPKNIVLTIFAAALFGSVCTVAAIHLSGGKQVAIVPDQNDLVERIETMESQLRGEREALLQLRELLGAQFGPLPANTSSDNIEDANSEELDGLAVEVTPQLSPRAQREQWRAQRLAQLHPDYKTQALVDAGFSKDEATSIVRTESEIELQRLQEQYDSRREQIKNMSEENPDWQTKNNPLRAKLGDDYYQKYMEAQGWPTSVTVASVMHNSPGEAAGLQHGDNILRYANTRVFNIGDLNTATAQGNVGESVLVEIERDGQPLQLTIPRGPIGVSSGRFGR